MSLIVEKQKRFHNRGDRAKIAEHAYYKWLQAGSPTGHDGKEFWFAAEWELTKADVILEEVIEVEV